MLTDIYLVNAQALKGAYRLRFDGVGLYRFIGDNNNGKSIAIKFITRAIKGQFKNPGKRRTMINRECIYADLVLVSDRGDKIHVHVTRDASSTFCKYFPKEGEPIKRYVSDGEWVTFFRKFGFHYNDKRAMSLNIYNTYDPLLFITTSEVTNLDMVKQFVSDVEAENAVVNMTEMDIYIKDTLKGFKHELAILEAQEKSLEFYDIETCKENIKKLLEYKTKILAFNIPELRRCKPVPNTKRLEALNYTKMDDTLKTLKFPSSELTASCRIIEKIKDTPNLKILKNSIELIESYDNAIAESKCPTCGRRWVDE